MEQADKTTQRLQPYILPFLADFFKELNITPSNQQQHDEFFDAAAVVIAQRVILRLAEKRNLSFSEVERGIFRGRFTRFFARQDRLPTEIESIITEEWLKYKIELRNRLNW